MKKLIQHLIRLLTRRPKLQLHTEETGSTADGSTQSLTAHPEFLWWRDTKSKPLPLIPISVEKPPYYTPIDIWDVDTHTLHENWHRVSDGDTEYYCKDDKVMFDVKWWVKRKGVKYEPYDPMTAEDIKEYSRRDLKDMIEIMKKDMVVIETNTDPIARMTYNSGVQECINIVNRKLRNTKT